MNDKNIKIDYVDHKAALFACKRWHYSKRMPVNKLVKIGIWEDDIFIGVIIFGVGASAVIHKQFNLENTEVCELVRVALSRHKIEVSYLVKKSLQLLKESNPGLKVCVSFADPSEDHIGIIYQAGNWIYTGKSAVTTEYFYNNRWRHVTDIYKRLKPEDIIKLDKRKRQGKHRYVMPLNKKTRRQIIKSSKPYPKKENCPEGVTGSTSGDQSESSGSSPDPGLI
ncbi:hypothetical protein LCGC14_2738490 [marine sediment metagenome]|uniref:Protein Mom n=1 Tax=marine sediment metagenome TaxID=412755 RepID=A0A0F8Z562_9ZZZZ